MDRSALEKQLENLGDDIAPVLRLSLRAVLNHGWSKVTWPARFNAVHLAALQGSVEALSFLVNVRADLTSCDDWGLSPLDYGVQGGHDEVVLALQKFLSIQNAENSSSVAPSLESPQPLEKGAHVPAVVPTCIGSAHIPMASNREAHPKGEHFVSQEQAQYPEGNEDLKRSAREDSKVADELESEMKKICDLVTKHRWRTIKWNSNFTGLHQAAKFGSIQAVRHLLDSRAEAALELKDANGWTPLDYARKHGHEAVAELLNPLQDGLDGIANSPSEDEAEKSSPQRAPRDEFKLGLGELYAELRRLQAENATLSREREKAWAADAPSPTSNKGAFKRVVGDSPALNIVSTLGEDELRRCLANIGKRGRDAELQRLQESPDSGGLGLCMVDAQQVLSQLELIARLRDESAIATNGIKKDTSALANSRNGYTQKEDIPSTRLPSTCAEEEPRRKNTALKPKVTPKVPMTAISWNRYVKDAQSQEYGTIWDSVGDDMDLVPTAELEERFKRRLSQEMQDTTVVRSGYDEDEQAKPLISKAKPLISKEMHPDMRPVCEAVRKQGWKNVAWKAKYTGLHKAANVGCEAAVRFLLEARANIALSLMDDAGKRPVDYAVAKGHPHLLALLTPGGRPRTETEISMPVLRAELRRLETDNMALRVERSSGETLDSNNSAKDALSNLGVEEMRTLFLKLQQNGRDAVLERLTSSSAAALDRKSAESVLKQLELMARICTDGSKEDELEKAKCVQKPRVEKENETVGCNETKPSQDKGKGKGKAPPGGPPPMQKKSPAAPIELHKPKVTPRVPMKPIWWTRYLMGAQLQAGDTIWDVVNDDMDLVPKDELEERFGKNVRDQPKDRPSLKTDVDASKPELKLLRIVTDTQILVGKEAALKKLPPAPIVARAILDLNDQIITIDHLRCILDHACPTPAQVEQLVTAREQNPAVPLGLPEQYMWVVSQISSYRARLDCWLFIRTYDDRRTHFADGLRRFEAIAQSCTDCKAIASLFGLVLAFGNYLNGGTDRGQADGFDFDTLARLESVKDPSGRDLRHLILDTFFNRMESQATELIDGLQLIFSNVSRALSRDNDGCEKLSKRVLVTLEDYDLCVTGLQEELEQSDATTQVILQCNDNSADLFRIHMPALFDQARSRVAELIELRDRAKDSYMKVLRYLKIVAMKSADFCLIWDNFFVPEILFGKHPDKIKREILIPNFCQSKPMTLEHLLVLWGFRDPVVAKPEVKRPSMVGRRSRPSLQAVGTNRRKSKLGAPIPSAKDCHIGSSDEGETAEAISVNVDIATGIVSEAKTSETEAKTSEPELQLLSKACFSQVDVQA